MKRAKPQRDRGRGRNWRPSNKDAGDQTVLRSRNSRCTNWAPVMPTTMLVANITAFIDAWLLAAREESLFAFLPAHLSGRCRGPNKPEEPPNPVGLQHLLLARQVPTYPSTPASTSALILRRCHGHGTCAFAPSAHGPWFLRLPSKRNLYTGPITAAQPGALNLLEAGICNSVLPAPLSTAAWPGDSDQACFLHGNNEVTTVRAILRPTFHMCLPIVRSLDALLAT
jgi:hypothetical protein